MASTVFLVGFVAAVVTEISSIRVRRVTVLLCFGFSAMKFFIAPLLQAIPLSATTSASIGSLAAGVSELRLVARVFGELYRILSHEVLLSDTRCSPSGLDRLRMGWLL